MKSVLKRRKHRKGIRPVRKGTLKVRLQKLPTAFELLSSIISASVNQNQVAPLVGALDHLKAGNRAEFERICRAAEAWHRLHDFMMKGHDHLKAYSQIKPMDLALDVINYVDPVYSVPETADEKCARCPLNADCSFKCYSDASHRLRWCLVGTGSVQLKPLAKELSRVEMAELALNHLS